MHSGYDPLVPLRMAGNAASPSNGRPRGAHRAARSHWPPARTFCRQPAQCGTMSRPGVLGFASFAIEPLLPERQVRLAPDALNCGPGTVRQTRLFRRQFRIPHVWRWISPRRLVAHLYPSDCVSRQVSIDCGHSVPPRHIQAFSVWRLDFSELNPRTLFAAS